MTGTSEQASRFVGSWRLVDCATTLADRTVIRPFGAQPGGVLMYGADGRMSVHLVRGEGLAEALAGLTPYTGYFGRFTVDPGAATVTHHLEGSSDPAIGGDQLRGYRFEDDRLILTGAFEGTDSELVWRRL